MANINEKLPGLGFTHIALRVRDFDKSYKFYTEVMGMKPTITWGEGNKRVQMFDLGDGGILELFAGGDDSLQPVGSWQHFAMKVDDVDKAYADAVSGGAGPLTPPKTVALDSKPYKVTLHIAFVTGPDNEQLEFFSMI